MKIAFLFGSLNRGGLETLMLDVVQNLNQTDFEAIGIYRKSGVLEDLFIHSGVQFTKLAVEKNKLKYLLSLRNVIRKNKVQIVHAQQPLDAVYAKLACVGLRIKIVLTFHGFDFEEKSSLTKFIIKKTDKNIFVSQYQRDYYVSKYQLNVDKQIVVYNGVNFNKFEKNSLLLTERRIKDELNLSNSTILLGMVGNFNAVRDQLFICRFLKILNDKKEDFHFIFIGKRIENNSKRYDECVEFCNTNNLYDKVSFLGVRDDVPGLLPQLDAFIYATEHDTFGIAVVEAIASGVPVFMNDWEVMNEITDNGELGIIYKTKDTEDLLQKIMLFLHNKEKYVNRAKENAQVIKERYSIEKYIENLKSLYYTF